MLLFFSLAALSPFSQEHSPDVVYVLLLHFWEVEPVRHVVWWSLVILGTWELLSVFWAAQGKQPFLRCPASTLTNYM